MKNKYENIDFKLGNTSLQSMFYITIPDYGAPIPECHSHGPISTPFMQPVYNIVNMINRGLHVQPSLEDSEKIYLFLVEYNREARKINKEIGEEINPIASEAEEYFFKKMKFKYGKEYKEENKDENPFVKTSSTMIRSSNVLNSTAIQNAFKLNKGKEKKHQEKIHKMFDIFSSPEYMDPDGNLVDNIAKKMNDLGEDMPNYMEDINFATGE